jgi:flagellar biosynthesis protein
MQLAFDNGIKVKEDGALAEMLAAVELDSPIPSEAFMAVAEILYYVYRANGEPNPFDAVLRETAEQQKKK